MPRLELSLLGPFEVRLDDEPVAAFHSDKMRALLAYLAVEAGRPHRRESLAGLLWPDYPERSAHTNLSNALSHLRAAIGDRQAAAPCLLADGAAVQLDPAADLWVDVAAFEHLVEADRSAAASDVAASEAAHRLEEEVALYRGPFLEGFSLPDSPSFEQWALVTRERLQRQVIEALERLGAYYEGRGDCEQALACARRQLEIEPWREESHHAAMRLLARGGDRSAALAQYEARARALRDELDVDPSEETVTLYQRIRDGTMQEPLATPPEPGARPEAGIPKHNLPLQLTPFVGREGTLREIAARLADPPCRLLTLVGPGGSGKTLLALEAAAQQVAHYTDGVYFVSLAPLQSVESIAPAIAQALGLLFQPGGEPRQQLLDYLRRKQMLLLADNFGHLLPAAGLVGEILQAAPEAKVLATSRARLGLQGEHHFPVEGMDYPDQTSKVWQTSEVWDALRYSAVQLFLSGARRVRPDPELPPEDLAQVVRICRLVEGMPLAILLAAAWMEMLTPDEIAAEVERSLDFLASDLRDVPERHTSVRAAFDHSWRLLTGREQEALTALSAFRGGCTRQAAQQVAGASLRDLMALVDKSLLGRTPAPSTALRTGGRYKLHELLRQYAGEKLDQSPDDGQGARDRHAAYYAAALEQWAADLKGPRQATALQAIEAEVGNAHAAWVWAAERGQVQALARAAEGLALFYDWHGRYQEGEAAFRAAADRLAAIEGKPTPGAIGMLPTQCRVLGWQGRFSQQLGHTDQAGELLRQGLGLLEGAASAGQAGRAGCPEDARHEKAFLLWAMGEIESWSGSQDQARQRYKQSLAIYRMLDDRWWTANALYCLADTAQSLGAYEEAKTLHEEALAIRRALGDQRGIALSLGGLGWVLNEQGDLADAERLVREGLAIAQTTGIPSAIDLDSGWLYSVLEAQGRFAEACSMCEDVMTVHRERADRSDRERMAANLGDIELDLGRYAEARLDAQRGLVGARKTALKYSAASAFLCLGEIAMAEGGPSGAGQRIREALDIFEQVGN